MDLDLAQGADLGGYVAQLAAKVDLHVGSTEKLAKELRRSQRRPPAQPVFGRTGGTGTYDSTAGYLAIRCAQRGPDQGHFWYIRNIVVGGLTPSLAVAGRGDVYITATGLQNMGSLAAIGMQDWRDWANFASGVAQTAFYGRGEMPLRHNEKIFMVITGGTNGQQYAVEVQYEDFAEGVEKQDWDL